MIHILALKRNTATSFKKSIMSIVTKLSDVLVKVQGSVDSTNAPLFEEELFSAISGQTLTIDAENLTYISSAGLRVLLKAKKSMQG